MKDFEANDGLTDEHSSEMLRPEEVQEWLKTRGIDVTPERAVQIFELLDRLSNFIISQQLRQCK